jgi:hypothetical protein
MDRAQVRATAGFGAAGGCVGVVGDVVWTWAAAKERYCYDYINLALFNRNGNFTDGTCYDPGSRNTRENAWVIGLTLLLAVAGAWLAGYVLGYPNWRSAIGVAVILTGIVLVAVEAIVPFTSVAVADLRPPWWPGPVTPPVWLLPLLLIAAFAVASLIASASTRVAGVLLAAVLLIAAAVAIAPVGKTWQHWQDRAVCPELADRPAPDVSVWC